MRIALFIIWPFAAFFHSLINGFGTKKDAIVLFLTCGFIGLSFATDNDSADIHSYIRHFMPYEYIGFNHFFQEIVLGYFTFSGASDLGIKIIYFICSCIYMHPKTLIVILGLTFGLFYSQVIYGIMKHRAKSDLMSTLLFILLVFLIFPTQGINQRFWIAGMMFLLGVQHIILNNKKLKGYALLCLSPVMHMGMALLVLGFFAFKAFKFLPTWVLVLFLPFALFISNNLATTLEPVFGLIGGVAEQKFGDYSGDIGESLKEQHSNRVWYAAYWRESILFSFSSLMFLLISKIKNDEKLYSLLRFTIFQLVIVAFMSQFSMSFRYYEMMIFMESMAIYLYIQKHKPNWIFNTVFLLITPVVLLALSLKSATILQMLEPSFFIANIGTEWLSGEMRNVWSYVDIFNN